jgi:excisionase family DNA binding protein
VTLADRLRQLAEALPPGGSLTLTRLGLLELAGADASQADQEVTPVDFTVAELAARFHRSTSTVRDWCEHGRFGGAYKLNGRDWRIPQAAVDTFVAEQRGEKHVSPLGAWRAARGGALLRRR